MDYGALENRLEEWLSAEGAPFKRGDDKATPYFSLQVMWEVNPFTIVVDKRTPHVITVITWWTLTVGQISKLDGLSVEEREGILRKIHLELVRREPSFILKDYYAKDGWIALQRSVYIEDLTRTYFFDSIRGLDVTMRTLQMLLEASFS